MTPCYICGSPMSDLVLDPRDMKPKPCATCNQIITEAAAVGDEDDMFVAYIEDNEEDIYLCL